MTRLAVLSDIHGNLPALQAVMADMENYDIDHVVVAGDSIGGGPFPRQVMEIIFEHNWAVIRGNNEFYSLDFGTARAPEHWSSYTIPPITNALLGHQWIQVIASLPDALSLRFRDAPPIYVTHGIPNNPWQAIYPQTPIADIQTWLNDVTETTVILAHSHVAMERHMDRWHIFNAGSVGVPLDGEHSASYMILEGTDAGWSLLEHQRIAFDLAPIYAEFERQEFVKQVGLSGQLLIEEFRTARLQLYTFHRWQNEVYPDQPESFEHMEEFLQLENIDAYIPIEYHGLDGTLFRD